MELRKILDLASKLHVNSGYYPHDGGEVSISQEHQMNAPTWVTVTHNGITLAAIVGDDTVTVRFGPHRGGNFFQQEDFSETGEEKIISHFARFCNAVEAALKDRAGKRMGGDAV